MSKIEENVFTNLLKKIAKLNEVKCSLRSPLVFINGETKDQRSDGPSEARNKCIYSGDHFDSVVLQICVTEKVQ